MDPEIKKKTLRLLFRWLANGRRAIGRNGETAVKAEMAGNGER